MTGEATDWVHGDIEGWQVSIWFEMKLIPELSFGASDMDRLVLVVAKSCDVHQVMGRNIYTVYLIMQHENVLHGPIWAMIT